MLTKKSRCILFLAAAFIVSLLVVNIDVRTAYAAFTERTIINDSLDNGLIDINYWKNTDPANTNVVSEEGSVKGLVCDDIGGGTGLVSASYIYAGATVDVNFIEYVAPEGGWLAFNFGTAVTGTDFVEYSKLDTGKVLMLRYIDNRWAIQSFAKTHQAFTGGDGTLLEYDTSSSSKEYPYSTVYFLDENLACENGILKSIILTVSFNPDGKIEVFSRNDGQAFDEKRLVAKSTVNLGQFYPGRVGIQFAKSEGTRKSGLAVSDLNVYRHTETGGMELAASLQDGKNALSQFFTYQSPQYGKMFYGQFGNLSFNKNSKDDAMVTLMTPVSEMTGTYENKAVFKARNTLRIKEIKGNKKFIVGFGLSNYKKTDYVEKGVTCIYFGRNGDDIVYGVTGFDDSLEEVAILSERALPDYVDEKEFSFEFRVKGNKCVALYFNGYEDSNFVVDGYAGNYFYSMGGANTDDNNYAEVLVDNISVKNAVYSFPGYADISADFTGDEFNNNVWRVSNDVARVESYAGNIRQRSTGVYVENEQLLFDNVNHNANITSVPEYANFELRFDITDIQREPVFEDGKMVKPASSWIGVMYGIPTVDFKDNFHLLMGNYKCPLICFSTITNGVGGAINGAFTENTKGTVQITNIKSTPVTAVLDDRYNMFSVANKDAVFSVRITLTDGIVTVSLKRNDDQSWYNVKFDDGKEYIDSESSPVGCVSIRGYGDGTLYNSSTFAVDNIVLANKDENDGKELTGFDFKTNRLPHTGETDYKPVLNEEKLLTVEKTDNTTKAGCGAGISSGNIFAIGILTAAPLYLLHRKTTKKNRVRAAAKQK